MHTGGRMLLLNKKSNIDLGDYTVIKKSKLSCGTVRKNKGGAE